MSDVSNITAIISVVSASLVSICSTVVPLWINHMNNEHQLQMKRMENFELKRIQMIEEYIAGVDESIKAEETTEKYIANRSKIYLYVDSDQWETIELIDYDLLCKDYTQAGYRLLTFAQSLDLGYVSHSAEAAKKVKKQAQKSVEHQQK